MTGRAIRLALLLLLVWAVPARAQYSVSARFDRAEARVGDVITLQVELQAGSVSFSDISPELPPQTNSFFDVLSSSSSVQTSIVNGNVSSSRSVIYQLRATREGDVNLGPVRVTSGGKTFTSAPLKIRIRKQLSPEEGLAQGERVPYLAEARTMIPPQVYPGQEIPVSLVLSAVIPFARWGLSGNVMPAMPKFRVVDLPSGRQTSLVQAERAGTTYHTANVKQWALYPLVSGDTEIPPIGVEMHLVQGAGGLVPDTLDPFFAPFFRQFGGRVVQAVTKKIPVHVEPLPLQGRPADFSGAVGQIDISGQGLSTNANVGDAIPYTIRMVIRGDADAVLAPRLNLPVGYDSFDAEVNSSSAPLGDGGLQTQKQFSYLLVPRRPGRQQFSPASFSWFDPVTGQYRTWQAPPVTIFASGAAEPGALPSSPGSQGSGSAELRYIKPDATELSLGARPPWGQAWVWALVLLAPAGFGAVSYAASRRSREESDRGWARYRSASKRFKATLEDAGIAVSDKERISLVGQAVLRLISDLWNFEAIGLTQEQLLARLSELGVPEQARSQLQVLLGGLDEVRFAGAAGGGGRDFLGEARAIAEVLREARS